MGTGGKRHESKGNISRCRLGDLEGLAQLTGVPLVELRMWQRWAQMRRAMGSLFYGLGILLGLVSLATIPLWEGITARLVAVGVSFVGALLASLVVHHVEASLLDYLPADRYEIACSQAEPVPVAMSRPSSHAGRPALSMRGH